MYTTHEEAAQAHTTLFASIISEAEALSELVTMLIEQKDEMYEQDDTDYDAIKELRVKIHIAEIEASAKYQEAQGHLMAANRHTEMAKWDVQDEVPCYCW